MRKIAILLFCTIFFGLGSKSIWAEAPSLDTSFGNNGVTVTSFGHDALVYDSAVQSDGKLVVVGNSSNGGNLDWRIARYNINGQLDNSFGNNGSVSRDSNSGNDNIESVAIGSDGKILVGGYTGPGYIWTVGQYNSDGSIDQSFGENGLISSHQGVVKHVMFQPDGKIVAVGYFLGTDNGGHDDVAVARYSSDGSADATFGNMGVVVIPIGSSNDRGISAIIQPGGKIIVFGEFDAGGRDEIFLTRFNQDGSLDTTFGASGKTLVAIGDNDVARKVILTSEGKILIIGSTILNGNYNIYVARFSNSGSLDSTFGINGKVIIRNGNNNDYSGSAILIPGGKILVGGFTKNQQTTYSDSEFRSFNEDGSIDANFGDNGFFSSSLGSKSDEILQLFRQVDGKIVTTGQIDNGNFHDWIIARFKNPYVTTLPVPLLKQNDNAWGSQLYDSANLWSNGSTDISSYGCALTSAAMVFEFNGIKNLPNGDILNPGTLNAWLKSQDDGYVRNGLVNWLSLSRLSMLAKSNNDVSFDALDYTRVSSQNDAILAENLGENIPPILEEPGHFVVATGTDSANTTFFINDPYYNRTSLADNSYNKSYSSMGIYTPVNSDLSYMMFVVNSNIAIALFDSGGHSVGSSFIQNPIVDDVSNSSNSVGPLKIFYFKQPSNGRYTLKLTSPNTTSYTLDEYLYDKNGNDAKSSFSGNVFNNTTDSYIVNFDKNDKSQDSFDKVNFDYIKNEIIKDYHDKKIRSFATYMSLITQLKIAQNSHSKLIQTAILNNMLRTISRDRRIDKIASLQLISDINLLKASL